MKFTLFFIVGGAVIVGCALSGGIAPGSSTAALPTATAPPNHASNTAQATAPASPTTAAPAPFTPFNVVTWAANVLLRSGPGYLFPQLAILREGSSLMVVGRSPGNEWLLVQTTENRSGWVFAPLVDSGGRNLTEPPLIQPASVQRVVGRLTDVAGQPISGIQFSLVQGLGNRAPRNDAVTDSSGKFSAFMPLNAQGTWDISFTAVSCKSNTMDSNCNCVSGVCGRPEPERLSLPLPQAPAEELVFTWK